VTFVKKYVPCNLCDSSNAASINEDGSAFCFSCGGYMRNYENPDEGMSSYTKSSENNVVHFSKDDYIGVIGALTDRGIKEETAKRYNVRVTYDNEGQIKEHYYPYYKGQDLVAYKIRKSKTKGFTSQGKIQEGGLFGQSICQTGGKYITITEGECDAMAAYELTGSRWPCVSIKNGAQSAASDIKKNLEFLETYENVIICFDNDKPGRDAAAKCAALFRPNKAKIMTLPIGYKDANDMLKKNAFKEYQDSFWQASTYTPTGIIRTSEKLHEWLDREVHATVNYPWEGLNDKLLGIRQGELLVVAGGTGLGKSAITRELSHHLLTNSPDKIGIVALEEDWRRTVDGIVSIEANDKIHLKEVRENYGDEELSDLYNKVLSEDKIFIHAHFGVNSIDETLAKLRFMIIGCDCKWIIVDHLHMFVSGSEGNDERKTIDSLMTHLRSLVSETNVGMICVSHLNRGSSEGHENGAEVKMHHIRGSAGISHVADSIIALERNQQSTDEVEAKTTRIRVLKSRYTGDVGLAAQLLYDTETGRLNEVPLEEPKKLEFEDIPF
jgi:twinkle protein